MDVSEIIEGKASLLCCVNVGNSFVQIGVFSRGELYDSWSVATQRYATSDEALICLRSLLGALIISGDVYDGVVSSVVPAHTDAWVDAIQKLTGRRPLLVGPGIKTGIRMRYNNPGELGADRVSCLVAAQNRYAAPFIVVNFGTATTIEVVDDSAHYVGGIIAPGQKVLAGAMSQEAAQLSSVELSVPRSIIGKNTRDALRSGIVMGEVARFDGLIESVWNELGYQTSVVATGSDAKLVQSLSTKINATVPCLILYGLMDLHLLNRRAR